MIEHKNFLKTPKKGQIVKVYLGSNKGASFGKVKRITKKSGREIVVLHTLNETFTAQQCDYCLDLTKVLFET